MAVDELRIKTLGGLSIELNDRPLRGLASRKAEALLVYVACNPRAHPREVLADLLWDDRTQQQATANLRVVLSSLRKEVGDFVAITRQTAAVAHTARLWLDVAELERAVAQAGTEPDVENMQALEGALALYEGDFLEGFAIFDARGLESWMAATRARLHHLAVEGWQQLGAWRLGQGQYSSAAEAASRLLALDPYSEAGCRLLLEALARAGRRGEALAQYETFRALLADELGVEATAETQALARAIEADALDGGGVRYGRTGAPRQTRLPGATAPLIGREGELEDVTALLSDGASLLSIVGPGGIGKTSLALEAARRLADRFADGAAFVSLSAVEGIVPAVAHALGMNFDPSDWREPKVQLLDNLRDKTLLLLLDNFEHLLDGAPLLVEMLEAAPGVKLLTTSRERLNMQAEHVYPLEGLAFSEWSTVAEAQDEAAVALFLHHARRARPSFVLRAEHLAPLQEILRLVQGMPLALILAAGWAAVMSPAEIAAEIGRSLDFLEATTRDLPARQRSMRAVFESSWQLLSPDEQRLFAAFSIFRGGFTLEAAREVTGASPRDLMRLVDRSLLTRRQGGRFEQHELLRQFAAEELARTPEEETWVRERHSVYYCRFIQEREAGIKGERAEETAREMTADFENTQLGFYWAADRRRADLLEQAAMFGFYCAREGRLAEMTAMGERAARKLLEDPSAAGGVITPDELPPYERRIFSFMVSLWGLFLSYERPAEKQRLLEEAVEHAMAAAEMGEDARYEVAVALSSLATVLMGSDYRKARSNTERALVLFEELECWRETAAMMDFMTVTYFMEADFVKAFEFAAKASRLWEQVGEPHFVAVSKVRLASLKVKLGAGDEEITPIHELVLANEKAGKHYRAAVIRESLAQILIALGRYPEAFDAIRRSHAYFTRNGDATDHNYSRICWSWAGLHQGHFAEAWEQTRLSLVECQDWQWIEGVAWCSFVHGCCALALGRQTQALELFKLSVITNREIDYRENLGWALAMCAILESSDPAAAKAQLEEALQLALDQRVIMAASYCLAAAASLAAQSLQAERAVELYALASRVPFVRNSRFFEDAAGRRVAEATSTLPDDVAEAARERGQGLDLWETLAQLLS